MKVAVIGSRGFKNYELLRSTLSTLEISLIISGGAMGADTLAEVYAKEKGIETKVFIPDWKTHGKKAGFLRNTDIVNESDLVVAFWDGLSRGTEDSIKKAQKLNKRILLVHYND